MVVVEARVHAAELGQAHRHVAVVEDHRDAEALAQVRRDAAEVRHRDGEDDHRVDVLSRSSTFVRCRCQRGVTQRQIVSRVSLVERGVLRVVLGAAEVAVALEPRERRRARLRSVSPSTIGRVRRRPPPRRLDRPAAVRRHDQVDADLVEPLPELPPRRRAAVAEVEVDRGRDREDLRRLHRAKSYGGGVKALSKRRAGRSRRGSS